uniref:Uncharacterized protein n=1 Tax=Aplanochytrium stocchinoi TaxID=215587 RepID=A0A7S3PH86_9STRA
MPTCAVMSNSTSTLRTQLAKFQIEFEDPLHGSLTTETKTKGDDKYVELLDELKRYEADAGTSCGNKMAVSRLNRANSYVDEQERSLLAFVGEVNVSGLYTFLMNRVVKRGGWTDVPLLMSPRAFVGSTMSVAKLSQPSKGARGNDINGSQNLYNTISVNGPVLPGSLSLLLSSVQTMDPEDDSLQAQFVVDTKTKHFNLALHTLFEKYTSGSSISNETPFLFRDSYISRVNYSKKTHVSLQLSKCPI